MICVYQCIFNLHDVHDHFAGRCQAFVEDVFHDVKYFGLKFVKLSQLRDFDLNYYSTQLLIYLISAI